MNKIKMIQQSDKSFRIETDQEYIPTDIVNTILEQVHTIYSDQAFSKHYENMPEHVREYIEFAQKKAKLQKFFTLFWFGVATLAIFSQLIGGK